MIPKSLLRYQGSRVRRVILVVVAALAGCSSYDSVTQRIAQNLTPYRITVVQGNFVAAEQVAQLQAGMSRAQVRELLGTPLLADMFHANRWDYLFYFKRGANVIVQQRNLVLLFEKDRLVSWTGAENLPSGLDLLAEIDGDRYGKKKAALAANPVAAAEVEAKERELPEKGANTEAARAANVATSQVPGASRSFIPSAQAAPISGGRLSSGINPPIQPQFQFHRQAQPTAPVSSPPVGPTEEGDDRAPAGTDD